MDKIRTAMMDKAREKRKRRDATRKARKPEGADSPKEGVFQDLKEMTQGALETVGGLVKTTALKIKGAVT